MRIVRTTWARSLALQSGITATHQCGGRRQYEHKTISYSIYIRSIGMTRNKYDDAYVMGYHNGYHGLTYDNQYDKKKQPQYNVKYKHGYEAGNEMKNKEQWNEHGIH